MSINDPLSPEQGYIIYNILMEYLDIFIYEYSHRTQGKSFPSLRNTIDSFLTIIGDLGEIDFSSMSDSKLSTREIIETVVSVLMEKSKNKERLVDSKKLGIFSELSSNDYNKTQQNNLQFSTDDIELCKSFKIILDN